MGKINIRETPNMKEVVLEKPMDPRVFRWGYFKGNIEKMSIFKYGLTNAKKSHISIIYTICMDYNLEIER